MSKMFSSVPHTFTLVNILVMISLSKKKEKLKLRGGSISANRGDQKFE